MEKPEDYIDFSRLLKTSTFLDHFLNSTTVYKLCTMRLQYYEVNNKKTNPLNDGSDSVGSQFSETPLRMSANKVTIQKPHYKYLMLGPKWLFYDFIITALFVKRNKACPFHLK